MVTLYALPTSILSQAATIYHRAANWVRIFPAGVSGIAFGSEDNAVFTALYDAHMIDKTVVFPAEEKYLRAGVHNPGPAISLYS